MGKILATAKVKCVLNFLIKKCTLFFYEQFYKNVKAQNFDLQFKNRTEQNIEAQINESLSVG